MQNAIVQQQFSRMSKVAFSSGVYDVYRTVLHGENISGITKLLFWCVLGLVLSSHSSAGKICCSVWLCGCKWFCNICLIAIVQRVHPVGVWDTHRRWWLSWDIECFRFPPALGAWFQWSSTHYMLKNQLQSRWGTKIKCRMLRCCAAIEDSLFQRLPKKRKKKKATAVQKKASDLILDIHPTLSIQLLVTSWSSWWAP